MSVKSDSLHGNCGGQSRWRLEPPAALHQLDGLLHLHLVVEGDELGLPAAFVGYQALLHVLLVDAVQSGRRR